MSLAELAEHPFRRVSALAELCELLAERSARYEETVLLAGGTDWIVERHMAPTAEEGARAYPLVVDVTRLPELRGIEIEGDRVTLGAATTFLEIRRHPLLALRAPLLAAMSREVGAVQIQARGTVGGNLATASPAADGVTALAALDAEVVLASVRGERSVPLASYFTGYKRSVRAADELIRAVTFALPAEGAITYWRKVGTRAAQAISKVALAAVAEKREGRLIRVGFGMASVAPTVALLPTVRALLLNVLPRTVTEEELDGATLADVAPIDDIRSTGAYRRHVACALVREFVKRV